VVGHAPPPAAPKSPPKITPRARTLTTAQVVIPPGHWQAAHADTGWALVSCMVSPGFEFSGFVLAEPGWEPG
ncbi:cupin domain-containing protein, partial [Sphingomonas ursincola]|uniref:cupin domain-containing protein n=1 Tax=Sphingomonas ursincola TaxID=56361 RepID=UPI0023537168